MIPLVPLTFPSIRKHCEAIQTTSDEALDIYSQIDLQDQNNAESSLRVTNLFGQVDKMSQAVHDLCSDKGIHNVPQLVCDLRKNVLVIRDQNKCEYREYSPNEFRLRYEPGPDLQKAIKRIQEVSALILPAIQGKKISQSPDTFEAFQDLLSDSCASLVGNLKSLAESEIEKSSEKFIFVSRTQIKNLAEFKEQISPILHAIKNKFGERSLTLERYRKEFGGLNRRSVSAFAQFIYTFNGDFQKIVQELFDSYLIEIHGRISVREKPNLNSQKPVLDQLGPLFEIIKDQPRYQKAYENWLTVQTAIRDGLLPSMILARLKLLNESLYNLQDVLSALTLSQSPQPVQLSRTERFFLNLNPEERKGLLEKAKNESKHDLILMYYRIVTDSQERSDLAKELAKRSTIDPTLAKRLKEFTPELQNLIQRFNSAPADSRARYSDLTDTAYSRLTASERTDVLTFANEQPTKELLLKLYQCASESLDLEAIGKKLLERGITPNEYRDVISGKIDLLSPTLQDQLQRSAFCKKDEIDEKENDFGFEIVANVIKDPKFLAAKKLSEALNSRNREEIQRVLEETQNIRFEECIVTSLYHLAAELQGGEFFELIFNQPQFEAFNFESYQSLWTNALQGDKVAVTASLTTHYFFDFLSEGPA